MGEAQPPALSARRSPFALFAAHPKALRLLFFTELWERFSFYGMRALLILYLTKVLSFADASAYAIYGAYTALVYVGPVLGGMLADRLLGARRAVTFGGVLIALGHFTLALSGLVSASQPVVADGLIILRDERMMQLFFLALALIITGEGFFKSNISTLVGRLYPQGDPRRDAGFTLFYMGINIGAFAAQILCGYLAAKWGWAYGFGVAGIGMLFGLAVFLRGLGGLGDIGEAPDPARLRKPFVGPINTQTAVYIGGALCVGLATALMQNTAAVGSLLALAGGAAVLGLVGYALIKGDPVQRDRIFVVLALSTFVLVFLALFEQAGSSLNLFADRNLDRNFLGLRLETAQYQSFNPLFIFLLAPLLSRLWPRLAARGQAPGTPAKFALGLGLTGAGFAVLVVAGAYVHGAQVAAIWLVLAYLLHTLGELCIQPIGLSMITKLTPPQIVGFVMGIWFMAYAAGQYFAALLAQIARVQVGPDGTFDPVQSLHAYVNLFGILAMIGFVGALFLLALRGPLQRRMHGAD